MHGRSVLYPRPLDAEPYVVVPPEVGAGQQRESIAATAVLGPHGVVVVFRAAWWAGAGASSLLCIVFADGSSLLKPWLPLRRHRLIDAPVL